MSVMDDIYARLLDEKPTTDRKSAKKDRQRNDRDSVDSHRHAHTQTDAVSGTKALLTS